jgi:hypothetical protein
LFVSDPIGTAVGGLLAFEKIPGEIVPAWTSGIMGLWIGCDLGYVFMITALLVYYLRVDWPEMARIAQEKAAQDAKPAAGAAAAGGGGDGGGDEGEESERAGLLGS